LASRMSGSCRDSVPLSFKFLERLSMVISSIETS